MRFLGKHATRDKQLLRLERELRRLWQASRESPLIPLERPIQRGWMKFYVLRADVRRRPDAAVFTDVLRAVNRVVYCRNRAFLSNRGFPILLGKRTIGLREWNKRNWPASHQRLFSHGSWKEHQDLPQPRAISSHTIGFKLVHDWWLEETIQPWFATHRRVALPDVDRRIDEIEAHFRHVLGWERIGWLRGRHVHCARWDGTAARREQNWSYTDALRGDT